MTPGANGHRQFSLRESAGHRALAKIERPGDIRYLPDASVGFDPEFPAARYPASLSGLDLLTHPAGIAQGHAVSGAVDIPRFRLCAFLETECFPRRLVRHSGLAKPSLSLKGA